MPLVLSGLIARCMEPNALGAVTQDPSTRPGRSFLRSFDAGEFDAARARTNHTGDLDEAAACALIDCVLQTGEPFGALDVDGEVALSARFLEVATLALGDESTARQLFDGGVLDRRGTGRHVLGSLPVRVIARELRPERKETARASLRGGWDEDLLNLLASAALRAEQHPEELLVLTPLWRDDAPASRASPREERGRAGLVDWLEAAVRQQATEVQLVVGQPVELWGAFGKRAFAPEPLTARDVESVLSIVLTASDRERFERDHTVVTGLGVDELGRFRVSAVMERGRLSCAIRVHAIEPAFASLGWPQDVVDAVVRLDRGLVVVTSPAGHGRSTFFSAVLSRFEMAGRSVLTLEEPRLLSLGGVSRQLELHSDLQLVAFASAARSFRHDVVGVDLLDDTAAAHHALELASEGAFVVLTLRAVSAASALHRLATLDAPRARRRLPESLAAVVSLRCFPSKGAMVRAAELLPVSEGLRRHLRGNESPAPPVLLDTEGPSLDDRLLALREQGALDRDDAARWMVDARRAKPA